jgi:hypothetical protein
MKVIFRFEIEGRCVMRRICSLFLAMMCCSCAAGPQPYQVADKLQNELNALPPRSQVSAAYDVLKRDGFALRETKPTFTNWNNDHWWNLSAVSIDAWVYFDEAGHVTSTRVEPNCYYP